MNAIRSRISPILVGISLALAGGALAAAQDAVPTPPKVIWIQREWLKPGKSGMAHDKTEAAFVTAVTKGKLQGHYIALNSMSGKSRALYLYPLPIVRGLGSGQQDRRHESGANRGTRPRPDGRRRTPRKHRLRGIDF